MTSSPPTSLPPEPGAASLSTNLLPSLGAVLEALDNATLVLGADGRIVAANTLAGKLLGEDATALPGRSNEELSVLLRRLVGGTCLGEVARVETSGYPRRILEYSRRPFADGIGWLVELRDVTDATRLETERGREDSRRQRELDALRAQMEAAEKFKMELTANVTHDLRTPLASIKASVSGLLSEDVVYDPAVLRETLSVIDEETDRLQRRVQNLLSMSRIESGDDVLHRDWVDPADVIGSTVESLRSLSGARQINLNVPGDLPMVLADYDQVLIALRNLLENALLYSPAEAPVEISAAESMGQLRIRVRDLGPGLMPDEFERVFEKFYRGRAARRIPGTGLGLPICRRIAEAHGGRLWVEHVADGGVAFVLSLPIDAAPALPAKEECVSA